MLKLAVVVSRYPSWASVSHFFINLQNNVGRNVEESEPGGGRQTLKRPSHGKLKFANSRWQTQVGACERHKNNRQTRWQTVGDK